MKEKRGWKLKNSKFWNRGQLFIKAAMAVKITLSKLLIEVMYLIKFKIIRINSINELAVNMKN